MWTGRQRDVRELAQLTDSAIAVSDPVRWLDTLGLRQELTYQPANHFWPLQWTETDILVVATVLLAGFCFWWTRRRLI